ncbi:MAG: FAD-dependent oxidoreductase [Chloroflexota bacterium]|nr:MAG: FAD-dependent oxidoreductase [Chloroflexota bacterium]
MKNKYDVIIVGAGPAGITAAYLLAKAGLEVVLFERGEFPGEKNMFGGVLYGSVLNQVVPNYWEEAPLERCITRKVITFLSQDASVSVDVKSKNFGQPPYNGFTVRRARFDRWYAQKAVEAGALLVTRTVVDDLLYKDGRVAGVRARREQGELWSDVVIAADGVNSLLARKAGLRRELDPSHVNLGIKEVIQLPQRTIEERFNLAGNEGVANEFVGGLEGNVHGGAFVYTNKDSLSVGIVAQLPSLKQEKSRIYDLLEGFKSHPMIQGLVKDGVIKEYSAHLVPEAGLHMMPQLYTDGMLVVGDAAGFVLATGLYLEGVNYAMASGMAAARTVQEAVARRDFGKASLARYTALLEENGVLTDLRQFKRAPELMGNPRLHELYPRLVCELGESIFTVDGQPRPKLLPLALKKMRGQTTIWQLLKDGLEAGRSLLW